MKKILLIFVAMTFCLTVSAQKKMTDREMEGLKGSVKTVFEDYMLTYVSSGPSEINKRFKSKEYYFDKNGTLNQEIYPSYNYKYIYSIIDGFKTFKSIPIKVDNSPKNTILTRDIDEEKPLEENEKIVPPDDRFDLKFVYEYDKNGKVVKEKHYGNIGKLWRISTFKYNNKGLIIEENAEDTVANTKYIYKYDDKDNLIKTLEERDVKNGIDSISETIYSDYKFDSQGNWLERKVTRTSESSGDTYSTNMIYYRKIAYY